MALSEAFSGTETVSTTEWSLTTDTAGPDVDTSDGVFQLFLELNNLAAGDVFEVKLYEKVLAGSTQRAVDSWRIAGAQGNANWCLPAMLLMHGWDFTLKKISGVDRSISWSIRKAA